MKTPFYFEIGTKKVFAGALDWPGWSRSGRDEGTALQALLDYSSRYAAAIRSSHLPFELPANLADFSLVERLKGDTTTDFGAPSSIPAQDAEDVDEDELKRLKAILHACWQALDAAAKAAKGRVLQTGPRGGGRDLQKILEHVLEAERAYLTRLGAGLAESSGSLEKRAQIYRDAALKGLEASAHGELPARGPRGGARWPARYFVRRDAWHVLDHAWEIEDRMGRR